MKSFAYIALIAGSVGVTLLMARDILTDLNASETRPDTAPVVQPEFPKYVPNAETQKRMLRIDNDSEDTDGVDANEENLTSDVVESDLNRLGAAAPDAIQPIPQSDAELPPSESLAPAGNSPQSAAPIRQQSPLDDRMITPGNFVYLGGFRPQFDDGNRGRFGYGGTAMAYDPSGDPDGTEDGFPGSLFLMGHRQQQMVAEISIPKPFLSMEKRIDDLPEAKILQPFADITSGLREKATNGSSEPFEIGGMHIVANRLHWTMYKYYNVDRVDYLSHGLTVTDLSNDAMLGPWHLGPYQSGQSKWHSYKNAGYITDIPKGIADRYLGGKTLMSGLQISTGRQTSSQGPALYAYKPNENLPAGGSLEAVPLLWYPMSAEMPGHHPSDSWQGAAWLTLGNKQAVVVIGRKGLGPVYYGSTRPGDCYDWKGYHASGYEVQILFYRPEDILAGAKKSVPNTNPWLRWSSKTPGGSLNRFMYQDCGKEIGGTAYDRERNLLYICEVEAAMASVNEYEPLPVIHVLKIVE